MHFHASAVVKEFLTAWKENDVSSEKNIGLVLQTFLYHGTLRMAYRLTKISAMTEFKAAAKFVDARFIQDLPLGYDALVIQAWFEFFNWPTSTACLCQN